MKLILQKHIKCFLGIIFISIYIHVSFQLTKYISFVLCFQKSVIHSYRIIIIIKTGKILQQNFTSETNIQLYKFIKVFRKNIFIYLLFQISIKNEIQNKIMLQKICKAVILFIKTLHLIKEKVKRGFLKNVLMQT